MKLLVLQMGVRRLGLPAQDVERVLFYAPPSLLAEAPVWLGGLINLDSELVPVVKLATLLGWADPEAGLHSHMLLTRSGGSRWLLQVERVEEVVEADTRELSPAPPGHPLRGLIAVQWSHGADPPLAVLVASRLLSREQRQQLDRCRSGQGPPAKERLP